MFRLRRIQMKHTMPPSKLITFVMNSFIFKSHRKSWKGCYVLSNDERRAAWALRYYGAGHHKNNESLCNPNNPVICLEPGATSVAPLKQTDG
jgi:hypothetical protein